MRDCAFTYCRRCKRKEWIPITQEDRIYAKANGGLFKKILDHGDHYLKVYLDIHGHLRRSRVLASSYARKPIA